MKKLKVLMVCDLAEKAPWDQNYLPFLEYKDWETERDVYGALKTLGHEVKIMGLFDEITPLVEELRQNRPDVVFNLCESFLNDREQEPNVVALFELFKVPYTGAGPTPLRLCKDKGLSKKILSFHRIKVPEFLVFERYRKFFGLQDFHYPAIVKPLGFEGSEGINQASLVKNKEEAAEKIKWVHETHQVDAIMEQFIEGREIYVGVMGCERSKVLPARELFFDHVPDGVPKFATYRVKWDESYRKKWGIRSGFAEKISDKGLKRLQETCKKIYKIFEMTGYARIDLRMSPDEEIYFIEANPNPSIGKEEEFALSAQKIGYKFEDLIEEILKFAIKE